MSDSDKQVKAALSAPRCGGCGHLVSIHTDEDGGCHHWPACGCASVEQAGASSNE